MGLKEFTTGPPSPEKTVLMCSALYYAGQHENCDSSVNFTILVLELAVMQLSQLWALGGWRDHQSPSGAFRHTQTHVHMPQTLTCTTNCGPQDLWCVNNSFFMQGLGKQYLEPIDRYAIYYPICWNASLTVCQ